MSPIRSSTHWANSTPPKEWLETRLGRAGTLIAGSGFPHEYQDSTDGELAYYKVGNLAGETGDRNLGQSDHRISRSVARKLGARIIPPGAIVWAKIGAALSLNRRRITSEPCCIDNNMTAFVPRPGLTTTAWMYYWMLALDFGPYANPGAVPSISEGLQARLPVLIPPLQMQRRIAAFLDHETARIDELVRGQEQLIQLLSEKRQAAIRHVAAKGMNPHVPMRESGVNWLGKIPAHWGLSPLKYLCRFFGGGTPAKENPAYWHGDIPWITAKDMKSFWVSQSIDTITQEAVLESSAKIVEPGALLIVVRSGILQRTIPVGINTVTTTVNQDMKALTFARAGAAEYIAYLIHGNETALLQAWRKQGATVESIEQEDLASTLVPVPPEEELSQITHELRRVIKQFEDLQLEAQKSIQVLSERRSALISAAVTGQLDLSDWQLPEPEAVAEVA